MAVHPQVLQRQQASQHTLGPGGPARVGNGKLGLRVEGENFGHALVIGGDHHHALTQTRHFRKSPQGVHHHGLTRQQRILLGAAQARAAATACTRDDHVKSRELLVHGWRGFVKRRCAM